MNYKILTIMSLVLVLSACTSGAEEQEARELSAEKSSGKIEILKNKIDLGSISMKDGKVDIEYTLKNTGTDPVVIKDGQTSCVCTKAKVRTGANNQETGDTQITSRDIVMPHGSVKPTEIYQTIMPGEVATVTATFDPNAHGPNGTGKIKRDVYLNTNSINSQKISLSFFGEVVK